MRHVCHYPTNGGNCTTILQPLFWHLGSRKAVKLYWPAIREHVACSDLLFHTVAVAILIVNRAWRVIYRKMVNVRVVLGG